MNLHGHIARVRSAIGSGQFVNEASVSTGIVLPILQELGWPVFDPQVVAPEYTVEGRRVDFALCHPRNKPAVFVEVKQPGASDGADRQLFEYAFHIGVPLAVLTDGREWHFYLPAGQGSYHERRVYRLDLIERDAKESSQSFSRYLAYEAVTSGAALKAATEDYEGLRRVREITSTIPIAWRNLLQEQDSLLLDLLADQVESLCGFRPELDSVAQFISDQVGSPSDAARPGSSTVPSKASVPTRASAGANSARTAPVSKPGSPGFVLRGNPVTTRSAIDTLIQFLRALAAHDQTFLDRFAALPRHGRWRRFVGRTPRELYPDREDLARDYTHELLPGWWVGTNYSSDQIEKIIRVACDVAGLRVGVDVEFTVLRRERAT